jgi:hypothetical protein
MSKNDTTSWTRLDSGHGRALSSSVWVCQHLLGFLSPRLVFFSRPGSTHDGLPKKVRSNSRTTGPEWNGELGIQESFCSLRWRCDACPVRTVTVCVFCCYVQCPDPLFLPCLYSFRNRMNAGGPASRKTLAFCSCHVHDTCMNRPDVDICMNAIRLAAGYERKVSRGHPPFIKKT